MHNIANFGGYAAILYDYVQEQNGYRLCQFIILLVCLPKSGKHNVSTIGTELFSMLKLLYKNTMRIYRIIFLIDVIDVVHCFLRII